MATHDDFDGVYFTVQSIRLHHPEALDRLEFLIVDNHPDGPQAEALEGLSRAIPGLRYVANRGIRGTAVRDLVFRLATTPYVLCVDSHVLLAPGALSRLLEYLDAQPDCPDLLQGPLVNDDLKSISTHFDPVWRAGMHGVWATDKRGQDPDAEPFEIPMQGLGLFACRRDAWPGLNPRFSGFGGEEGYLHEKFRQRGARCLCLPFLRWVHRFQRPAGPSYQVSWSDRVRNYLLGLHELGAPDEDAVAHFRDLLGQSAADALVAEVRREIASPFYTFDAIYCVSPEDHWQEMQRRLAPFHIGPRLRQVVPVEGPAGRALAHRGVLEEAKQQALETVLAIDEGAAFVDDAEEVLRRLISGLPKSSWDAVQLGGDSPTTAMVYHQRALDRLLAVLPSSADEMNEWLESGTGFHKALAREVEVMKSEPPVVVWRSPEQMAARPTSQLSLRPDADIAVLEDSVLVYGQGSGPAVSLNPTAGLVARLIDGERSEDEIVKILQALYPDAEEMLPSEVEKVLGFLWESGLLASG